MTKDDSALAASEEFYSALNSVFNKDPAPMSDVWLHSDEVTAMRPNGGREVGWEALRSAWKSVAEVFEGGKVELTERVIIESGEFAYEIGLEKGTFYPGGKPVEVAHRATNIFRRVGGSWKIVHHHTDKSDGAIAVFESLEPPG
ncbi:MAG: nuclear transport factor 2 family protein [Pseudomonadota bacterium]